MIRTRFLLPCTILLLGLASGHAQDPPDSPDSLDSPDPVSWESIRPHQLHVAYYLPRWTPLSALVGQANDLYLDAVYLLDASTGLDRPIQVFQQVNDRIMVRGSKAQVDHLLGELARFDEAMRLPEGEPRIGALPELQMLEYEPRYSEIGELYRALERYQRVLELPASRVAAAGRPELVPNLTLLPQRGLILVQETPERAAEIRAFLERLDRPEPQVTVHYLVLRGSTEADAESDLPGGLADHLRALVPFPHFQVETSGLLRGSARQSMQVRLENPREESGMHLELEPASFDPASRTLTLRRCRFELVSPPNRRSFETGAALVAGEHTVIGAAGPDSVLLVLRLSLD